LRSKGWGTEDEPRMHHGAVLNTTGTLGRKVYR
jgi:hypothetical protein